MSRNEPPEHLKEMKPKQPERDQQGSVPSELKVMIQAEVRAQLDRERAVLRDAGNLAFKIVGGAIALLLAIFTIFGLTTWKDVANQTTDYMKQRVDALIQSSDLETGVRQTLNNLVNRAILAAELASLDRRSGKPQDVPKFEWDRLKAWLKFESLETQEFRDTLAILNAQSAERKKADANGFLSEMLNPPEASPYRWIVRQPEKRKAIMYNFNHTDLGAAAVAIAVSSASEDLRLAAISYIRELNYTDGFDKIVAVASASDDGPLKSEALLTIATLRPTNRLFLTQLKKLMSELSSSSMKTAITIALQLWQGRTPSTSDIDTQTRFATVKELLAFAFDGGVYISLGGTSTTGPATANILVPKSRSSAPPGFSFTSLTLEEFGELKPYWALLADAANASDNKKVSAYMFSGTFFPIMAQYAVAIKLGEKSSLIVKSETGNDIALKADDVAEILLFKGSSGDLFVQWRKDNQVFRTGTISNFSGKDFEFSGITKPIVR